MYRCGLEDGIILRLIDTRKDVEWIHLRDKNRVVNTLVNSWVL
jgi:hypothetical protein